MGIGQHTQIGIADLIRAGDGIIDLLPQEMATVTQLDAEYHASVRDEWIESNQVDTERNRKFHDDALAELAAGMGKDAVVLELGGGVGYDALRFLELRVPFRCYIVSEISPHLLEYAKQSLRSSAADQVVRYCCLDAGQMLIASTQVDRLFAVAALHHFPNLDQALAEIDRVTKPGAKIIFAIEPNRLWSSILITLRPWYRALFRGKSHSAADEEAEGFRLHDFKTMGARFRWKAPQIVPVWFFTGFLHLGLESLYRLLRLKKRVRVPIWVEKTLLLTDSIFFTLPFANRLAWHYTVTFDK